MADHAASSPPMRYQSASTSGKYVPPGRPLMTATSPSFTPMAHAGPGPSLWRAISMSSSSVSGFHWLPNL